MAKKADAADDGDLFKGLEEVGTPDVDGWFKPEEGLVFTGQLVGRIQIPNEDKTMRDAVLVKLSRPTKATIDGSEGETLEAGKILAVGIRAKLIELLYYVEHKGTCAVRVLHKQKLKGGHTMWNFKIGVRGKKATPPPMISRAGATERSSNDGDEIPF